MTSDDYPRSHRVADFIQRELSGLIRTELRDPRISPMLTIASVEVSRDLSVAKVYWSVLDAAEKADTQTALKRASGFLRRRLAQEMQIRSVPELRFHHDDSAARGAEMSALIAKAVASNTTVDEAEDGRVGEDGTAADSAETVRADELAAGGDEASGDGGSAGVGDVGSDAGEAGSGSGDVGGSSGSDDVRASQRPAGERGPIDGSPA